MQREIRESNDQMIAAFTQTLAKLPKHKIIEREGLVIINTNTDNVIFNPIFFPNQIQDEADLETRLKTVSDYLKKSKVNRWIVICEDFLPEAIKSRVSEIFARYELGFFFKMTGMATEKLVPFEKAIPELECRRIENVEMGRVAGEINAIAYHMPLDSFHPLFTRETYWDEKLFGYLGYVEGKPVSTAVTFENQGKLYLAWVATLPEYRNKGYAKKVVWHSVEKAQENSGISSSVLHATEEGFPVYKKLGYSPVASFLSYTSSTDN
ncbi:MAG: GNAT family N-acetyltransferase [Okeania sp. SIO2H7]|nr:GNAT family N-acetyltransferase [Okeania sp. SIO2H7]